MVAVETVLRLFGGVFLLLMNGYFVVIEFAMTRVRQFDESEFHGSSGLERAWEMTDRLEIYLSGCQLGITIASVGLGVVAEPALASVLAPVAELTGIGSTHAVSAVLALSVINLLHVIVGEQAPTYLGIERTRFVAGYGSGLLYWWTKIMSPVIVLADGVAKWLLGLFGVEITRSWTEAEEGEDGGERAVGSRADLHREMGDVLGQVDDLSAEREEEVLAALQIGMVPVRDIAVPRDEIVALSTADSLDRNLETLREAPLSRFPLVGDSLDDYRGNVYAPTVLRRYE